MLQIPRVCPCRSANGSRGHAGPRVALALLLALLPGAMACGSKGTDPGPPRSANAPARLDPSTGHLDRPKIAVLGDSLTAGLGLPSEQAYPALLQRYVDEAGYAFEVVNMGVSGDTSAGGLTRLDWALEGDVRVVIVALGANDALRGLSPVDMAANLSRIIDRAHARGITVVLCGMEAPPNFGAAYTSEFRDVYRRLAREKRAVLIPFLLDGVAGNAGLNQADGIHPNAAGARRVADLVWAGLQPVLDSLTTAP
jgi:acyl-CoA thioesterase-1